MVGNRTARYGIAQEQAVIEGIATGQRARSLGKKTIEAKGPEKNPVAAWTEGAGTGTDANPERAHAERGRRLADVALGRNARRPFWSESQASFC